MFQRISIQNYKSIKTLENFELKPVNILIGANNSGKSNFLDVFAFLRDTLVDDVSQDHDTLGKSSLYSALARRGDGESICHTGEQHFSISCSSDRFQYVLEIALRRDMPGYYRKSSEHLFPNLEDENGTSDLLGLMYFNKLLSQQNNVIPDDGQTFLYKFLRQSADDARKRLAQAFAKSISEIKIYDRIRTEKWSPIRLPQISKGETVLDEDGGNLIGVLHQLAQIQPKFLPDLNVSLKALFSDFSRIAFPSNEEGKLDIRWEDANGRVLNSSQLSDGTLKFLCLIAILRNPNPPALIGLDEPEAKLNPWLQSSLIDMIQEAAQRTQIIATTHNPDFVSNFSPEEILILQQHRGETEIRRFSTKGALERWLEDFGTRELWLMGELESRW